MIHRLSSSLATFKALEFRQGLNILAAVKTKNATERQTRNGAGKTSFVEIVHFLMGSDVRKGSLFKSPALESAAFTIDFDLAGTRTAVSRACAEANWVIAERGNYPSWPVQPTRARATGDLRLKNNDWKRVLGTLMFDVRSEEDEEDEDAGGQSFRRMFSYFARRQLTGGFNDPLKTATQQEAGSVQVNLTSLLALDWKIPQELHAIRQREKSLKELKKAANTGALGGIVGKATDLRKQAALLQDRVMRLKQDLGDFKVVAEYGDLEKDASALTRQINALSDENVLDQQVKASLGAALESERSEALGAEEINRLYKEAGVALPSVALRRVEDVQAFHESIVANRRSYLEGELQAAEQRLNARTAEMTGLSDRLAEIMRVLKSARALDQFSELQSELARREAEYESVRRRLEAVEQLEGGKARLGIDRNQVLLRLQQDHQEQVATINKAIVIFEEISKALYESAGSFSVGQSENGPVFELAIEGARSKGIASMQLFCFDMMLMRLVTDRKQGPGFLIHDSHIFDGVDERQVGTALRVGAEWAKKYGFQYIVTMNEDAIPRECPPNFDPRTFVLPVKLTDASETGGLFGFRFE